MSMSVKSLTLEIPEDVLADAKIAPDERAEVLKRELAVHLCARGILSRTAARRLSGMERVVFEDLLGRRGIPMGLTPEDIDLDLRGLDAWRAAASPDSDAPIR